MILRILMGRWISLDFSRESGNFKSLKDIRVLHYLNGYFFYIPNLRGLLGTRKSLGDSNVSQASPRIISLAERLNTLEVWNG